MECIPQIEEADVAAIVECLDDGVDALGSMPLGNGDISVNVWAERDGDLLLYVGKCDSWDENERLLKLRRIRNIYLLDILEKVRNYLCHFEEQAHIRHLDQSNFSIHFDL